MVFGKRNAPPAAPTRTRPPPPPGDARPQFPWSSAPDAGSCNLAFGNLAHNIKQRLTHEGRLHAETLMVGIGAIAGFCALHAVNETLIKTGKGKQGVDFHIMTTADGGQYLFGDALNSYLVDQIPQRVSLYAFLAGTAISNGLPRDRLPDIAPLFASVSKRLGGPEYGAIVMAEGAKPILQPLQALNILWPLAKTCFFSTKLGERDPGPPAFDHWPLIASYAAAGYLAEVREVLSPRTSLLLAMEAAIIASKVMPATVAEGRM